MFYNYNIYWVKNSYTSYRIRSQTTHKYVLSKSGSQLLLTIELLHLAANYWFCSSRMESLNKIRARGSSNFNRDLSEGLLENERCVLIDWPRHISLLGATDCSLNMELAALPRLTYSPIQSPLLKPGVGVSQRPLVPSLSSFPKRSIFSLNRGQLLRMSQDPQRPISCAVSVEENGSTITDTPITAG